MASNSWEHVLDLGLGEAWDVSIEQVNQVVWACGTDDSIKPWMAKSRDKGNTWETTFLELDNKDSVCYKIAIHPVNPEIIYIAIGESVIKTSDGGKTWHYAGLRDQMVRMHNLVIDPFNPDHLWAAGEINENYLVSWITPFILYESFDAGATWRFVPSTLPRVPKQSITSIVADPNRQNVLYIATKSDGVWRYETKKPSFASYLPLQEGNWWTFSNSLVENIIDSVKIGDNYYFQFDQFHHISNALLRMTDDNKLLLRDNASEQAWLYFSANIGDSWKITAPGGGSEWMVHLQSKSDTVTVPAGTFTNCYRFWFQFNGTDNDWIEWYAPGIGPVKRILHGFAVIEYPLTSAYVNGIQYPTAVAVPPINPVPEKFHLYPNYPNPFNNSTILKFDLRTASLVTLEIYNVVGQKIYILVNERRQPGSYHITWDGTDDSGILTPTGIYFVKLLTDDFVSVRKMLVIR
ncbi:MAG TPA: T9SS type A sorting domain-containing protein [bacterium]